MVLTIKHAACYHVVMKTQTLPVVPGEHPVDRAARFLGGRPQLAKALDVTPAAIGNWKTRGIPIEKCVPIERLCPGVLSRRDLREDWAEIWPELVESYPHPAQAEQGVSHA